MSGGSHRTVSFKVITTTGRVTRHQRRMVVESGRGIKESDIAAAVRELAPSIRTVSGFIVKRPVDLPPFLGDPARRHYVAAEQFFFDSSHAGKPVNPHVAHLLPDDMAVHGDVVLFDEVVVSDLAGSKADAEEEAAFA